MFANTNLNYTLLLILSIGKRSFAAMSKIINKSGMTISRLLMPSKWNFMAMEAIAKDFFIKRKKLYIMIDDTLIRKIYSKCMNGSGWFYDTKIGRSIRAYKLSVVGITDGKYAFPLFCAFLFDKKLATEPIESAVDITKRLILNAVSLFPEKELVFVADGAFATVNLLTWLKEQKIDAEMRMHSNRKVKYQGKMIRINTIKQLELKGRQKARTVLVEWHGLLLYITAQLRENKHGEESVVFQAANYYAKPKQHVLAYEKRWQIEKLFRTAKQHLGLQECFSTKIDVQMNHVASVLTAYSLLQIEMKRLRLRTPELALKTIKSLNMESIENRYAPLNQIFKLNSEAYV